jgi:hypothetical protein
MHTGIFCMKEQKNCDWIKLASKCEFICFKIIPEHTSIYKYVGVFFCDSEILV